MVAHIFPCYCFQLEASCAYYETFARRPFCPMFVPVLLNAQPIRPGSGLNYFYNAKKSKKGQTLITRYPSICKGPYKLNYIQNGHNFLLQEEPCWSVNSGI